MDSSDGQQQTLSTPKTITRGPKIKLGDTRAAEKFKSRLQVLSRMEKEGKRFARDRSYRALGYKSREQFMHGLQNQAFQAFVGELLKAQIRVNEKYQITARTIHEHPASIVERALDLFFPFTGLSLLGDDTYARLGTTRDEFVIFMREQRLDRLRQTFDLLGALQYEITDREDAGYIELLVDGAWGDLVYLGIDPTQSGQYGVMNYNSEQFKLAGRNALENAIPILRQELGPRDKPRKRWKSVRILDGAVSCYLDYMDGTDIEPLLGMSVNDYEVLKQQAFGGFMRNWLPRAKRHKAWVENGLDAALRWQEFLQESGWEGDPDIDAIFNHLGYASFNDFFRKTAKAQVQHLAKIAMSRTIPAHDAFNALMDARDALIKHLDMDEDSPRTFIEMSMTRQAFYKHAGRLAAKAVRIYYDQLFDPSLIPSDQIRLTNAVNECMSLIENFNEQASVSVSEELVLNMNHGSTVRMAEAKLLNFLISHPTPQAVEFYNKATEELDEIGKHFLEAEVYTGMGLRSEDAGRIGLRADLLDLEREWRGLTDNKTEYKTRYGNLIGFLNGVETHPEASQVAQKMRKLFGFKSYKAMKDHAGAVALKLSLSFYNDLDGAIDKGNWTAARDASTALSRCVNLQRGWKGMDEFSFRLKFGFGRIAWMNRLQRIKDEEKSSARKTEIILVNEGGKKEAAPAQSPSEATSAAIFRFTPRPPITPSPKPPTPHA